MYTAVAVWLGSLSLLGALVRLAIVWLALRGTKPSERPAILRTLPPIFRNFGRDRRTR
jgi:hypothetical protein